MINKNMFDTSTILSKALDASWMRNQVISENIANVDTPGYKRKDVQFENALQEALRSNNNVSKMDVNRLEPEVIKDKTNLSYRLDGNNVNIDTEMVNLANNQIKYNTLVQQLNSNFSRIKMVLNK